MILIPSKISEEENCESAALKPKVGDLSIIWRLNLCSKLIFQSLPCSNWWVLTYSKTILIQYFEQKCVNMICSRTFEMWKFVKIQITWRLLGQKRRSARRKSRTRIKFTKFLTPSNVPRKRDDLQKIPS